MKTILFIRHAKSDWADPSIPDFERPLNKRGLSDAPIMAQCLADKGIYPDLIISSPAERAISTASIFASVLQYPDELIVRNRSIYSSSIKEILKILAEVNDSINTVFLFGHNPDISVLSAYLSNHKVDSMPTCSISCIDINTKHWKDLTPANSSLRFFEYPKMHK